MICQSAPSVFYVSNYPSALPAEKQRSVGADVSKTLRMNSFNLKVFMELWLLESYDSKLIDKC